MNVEKNLSQIRHVHLGKKYIFYIHMKEFVALIEPVSSFTVMPFDFFLLQSHIALRDPDGPVVMMVAFIKPCLCVWPMTDRDAM